VPFSYEPNQRRTDHSIDYSDEQARKRIEQTFRQHAERPLPRAVQVSELIEQHGAIVMHWVERESRSTSSYLYFSHQPGQYTLASGIQIYVAYRHEARSTWGQYSDRAHCRFNTSHRHVGIWRSHHTICETDPSKVWRKAHTNFGTGPSCPRFFLGRVMHLRLLILRDYFGSRGIIHSTGCNLSSTRLLTVAMKICLYAVGLIKGVFTKC